METDTTPFDLNHAIQTWREELDQSPAFRRENLDELETHLRDSLAVLQTRGLSEEEAFWIAVKRAGNRTMLGEEFGKVNRRGIWLDRVLWMLIGNLLFCVVSDLLTPIGSGLIVCGFRLVGGPAANSTGYLWISLFSLAIRLLTFAAVLALCWHLFTHHGERINRWLARNCRSSGRLATMVLLGIFFLALVNSIPGFSWALIARSMSQAASGRFVTGLNLASMASSLVESSIFVILALWLARRQLLAKS